jgi:replicative DNA helicase
VTGNGGGPAREALEAIPDEYWDFLVTAGREEVDAAERAVLGKMIASAALAGQAAAILPPQRDGTDGIPRYFGRSAHQVIYETVLGLLDRGEPVEPGTVLVELGRAGLLTRLGGDGDGTGGNFLHALMADAGDIGYHAVKVLAAWQQRNLAVELRSCSQIAAAAGFDPGVHLDLIRARVETATAYAGHQALRPPGEDLLEVLDEQEAGTADPGLPTGFGDLDEVLGGMRRGQMIVIAARPAQGKTTLALNIADHITMTLGVPGFVASLEMRRDELQHRRIAAAAGVPAWRLARGRLEDRDWDKIAAVHEALASAPLWIDDTPGVPLAQVRGRLAEMARTGHRAGFAVIDHIGLLAAPKAESRQQAVSALARGVKTLARTFDIPVILVCPVNRGPDHRTDRVPRMSDIRESGDIEGNADVVLLLHREKDESPRAGEADLIVAKNRTGPEAVITLVWQGHYSRLVPLAGQWSPSGAAAGPGRPDPVAEADQAAQERRDRQAEQLRQAGQ